jgi:large subunit ribosomal protein L21e
MVKKSHGFRARTRSLMSKSVRKRGLSPLSSILSEYPTGQHVDIIINPSFHKGMPHRRYHGRTGIVKGQRGRAVLVEVSLGKAKKQLIVRPEHLQISKD